MVYMVDILLIQLTYIFSHFVLTYHHQKVSAIMFFFFNQKVQAIPWSKFSLEAFYSKKGTWTVKVEGLLDC